MIEIPPDTLMVTFYQSMDRLQACIDSDIDIDIDGNSNSNSNKKISFI
jgi:hypothetical protein